MKTLERMKRNLFLIGCGVAMLLTYGCSKDNPLNPTGNCFGGNWAENYASELQTWSDAATAYSEDPTSANCDKYKTAAKNYLDALKEVADCVPTADRAELNKSINEAKADIDKEGCD